MRIIAGEHRGRVLKAPKGDKTRPTTDRVRESMMSVVANACGGFEGLWVLDAFAGSGALGLEALSRGAAGALFYEVSRSAFSVLRGNIALLGYPPQTAQTRNADILKNPPCLHCPPFDAVFLDPPYAYDGARVMDMVSSLRAQQALSPDALIVYEHAHSSGLEIEAAAEQRGFVCFQRKTMGETDIRYFRVV